MNISNFNDLIENYLGKFEYFNNDIHTEYYKQEAIKCFKDHWDIDANDFANMFKNATSKTFNLINNRIIQPTNGIVKLAEKSELTEKVRECFRTLYETDDGGDIDKRQKRIGQFVDEINALLDKYEPGKWKYKQDFRTVLFYLNLFAPEQNYIYKATQAKEFMYCIEYTDDFGSGVDFRLKKYYAMCDWLVMQIKNNPLLIKTHRDRITDKMYDEDNFHILAFDIIYCAVTYKLYNGIEIFRPTKKNAKERAERLKKEALESELKELSDQLNELLVERSIYDEFSAVGLKVNHKKFGDGIITSQSSSYIVSFFQDGERKFMIPSSFANGFLTTDDREVSEILSEMSKLDERIENIKFSITEKKNGL